MKILGTRDEGEWLAGLSEQEKAQFLAALIHELTIVARSTYRPQTEELENPRRMRKVNEIQHRIAACLRQVLSGRGNDEFQVSIAAWVFEESDPELRELLSWAWAQAKRRPQNET